MFTVGLYNLQVDLVIVRLFIHPFINTFILPISEECIHFTYIQMFSVKFYTREFHFMTLVVTYSANPGVHPLVHYTHTYCCGGGRRAIQHLLFPSVFLLHSPYIY